MSLKQVKAFAPATIGNIGCGFDVLGMAVEAPGDVVTLKKTKTQQVKIKKITGDDGKLPLETEKNTAGVAALEYLAHYDIDAGVEIKLKKQMPMGSGLGSSAASAAATLKAIDKLFGKIASREQLLKIGMQAESTACGSEHADNIAPSLFGGIVLVRCNHEADIIPINVPAELECILVYPHIEIKTADARNILPEKIELSKAVKQWGNIGGLISGFFTEDYRLISRSLKDWIIEPVRASLIPGFQDVKTAALEQGALGCSISGSGPTVFALADSHKKAEQIGTEMQAAFTDNDLQSELWISKVNKDGAKII